MNKWIVCSLILGIGLLAGGAALAQVPDGARQMDRLANTPLGRVLMGRLGRAMALRAELNLTDEQRAAVRAAVLAHRQELATAARPVVQARRALRDAVLATHADDATIRHAADELGRAIGDAAVALARVKADVASKANLTPEQMKLIAEFRADNEASVDAFLHGIEQGR